MSKRTLVASALAAVLFAAGACGVHQTSTPSLTGPSDFGLSVTVTASPDSINQDGGSQSAIRVTARDAGGRAISGETFRIDVMAGGSQVDFGTLSARTIVTGADGTASATYTAPPASPAGAIIGTCGTNATTPGGNSNTPTPGALAGQCVSIVATPISGSGSSNDFSASQSQSVLIRLMPIGVIVPPDAPVPVFVVTPTPVNLNVPALFDGSNSCAVPLTNNACAPTGVSAGATIVSYNWSFGDGTTGTGRTTTHTYSSVGTFTASLTVTNSAGVVSSQPATQQITVASLATPSGDFIVSPTAPAVNDTVNFSADPITAAPGHQIVQYSWNFGDGSAGATGLTAQHQYTAAGSYTVILSVADDSGQKKTFTKTVSVGTGVPTASFTFAPTGAAHTIVVDGSASTAAGSATISTYAWTWGDGNSNAASAASTATHAYAAGLAGTTVTVTLTVTDSLNRVGSTSQSVTVP